jgi:phage baseplate assembly protein W
MARSPVNIAQWEKVSGTSTEDNTEVWSPNIVYVDTSSPQQLAYTYSDVNLYTNSKPNDEVRDIDSVKQSLWMIIGTPKRSRWFRPNFGTAIESLLFDPLDYTTATRIRSELTNALGNARTGDRRIVVSEIQVIPDTENQHFFVKLVVTVPSLNIKKENIEFGLRSL